MGTEIENQIQKAINLSALKLLAEVKKETPVITGNLRNSIRLEKTGEGFVIGTNSNYAEAVELGLNRKGKGRHMFLKSSLKFSDIFFNELKKL